MKKRTIKKQLRLRKDTLRTLGQDAMSRVQGGATDDYLCYPRTEDQRCIEATLAQGCVHPTGDDTMDCTYTCNLDCTNGCTLGCPTVTLGHTGCNCP
jgi:hypothetical protein